MTKQPASVVHVRLPPGALEALRKSAGDKGTTVHAEIIERLEGSLAAEKLPVGLAAIRRAVLVAIDRFAGAEPASVPRVLTLLKATLDLLFEMFGAAAPDGKDKEIVQLLIVDQMAAEMRSRQPTPLGEAGRILLPKTKS